jgi:hypothetical protein
VASRRYAGQLGLTRINQADSSIVGAFALLLFRQEGALLLDKKTPGASRRRGMQQTFTGLARSFSSSRR